MRNEFLTEFVLCSQQAWALSNQLPVGKKHLRDDTVVKRHVVSISQRTDHYLTLRCSGRKETAYIRTGYINMRRLKNIKLPYALY